MGTRRKAREAACQILYQMDSTGNWDESTVAPFWELIDTPPEREGRKYTEAIVAGVIAERSKLDKLIGKTAKNWTVERMSLIDRNIMRAAVWEMRSGPRLAPGIVIDEWLEIAKRFGGDPSPAFINGILDKIAKTGE